MEADASSVASRMNALLQREQQVTQQLKACSAYVTAHSLADCEPFPVDEHGALQCQDMGAIAELHAKIDRFVSMMITAVVDQRRCCGRSTCVLHFHGCKAGV